MKNQSKILLSFVIGALAGAATGLLLAPDKGEVTRKKIKDSVNDLSDKTRDIINDLGDKAKETINDLGEKTKETINDLSEKAKNSFRKGQTVKGEEQA